MSDATFGCGGRTPRVWRLTVWCVGSLSVPNVDLRQCSRATLSLKRWAPRFWCTVMDALTTRLWTGREEETGAGGGGGAADMGLGRWAVAE